MIGTSQLHSMPISIQIGENEIMSKFDFALTIRHNLRVTINYHVQLMHRSICLIEQQPSATIAQRFHSMLQQIFQFSKR